MIKLAFKKKMIILLIKHESVIYIGNTPYEGIIVSKQQ